MALASRLSACRAPALLHRRCLAAPRPQGPRRAAHTHRPACTAQQSAAPAVGHPAAPPAPAAASGAPAKLRIVVLGSGWGAMSFVRNVETGVLAGGGPYELLLISPRDYFLFTPLLPLAMSGSLDDHTLTTPITKFLQGRGTYLQASCTDVDPAAKLLTCQGEDGGEDFTVPYDVLVLAVGSINNTFATPGAAEHAWFMKSHDDARRLREHIRLCLARAALPTTSPEERRRLLSFVVVGGGPAGVEVAAELHDYIAYDAEHGSHPHIKSELSVTLVHSQARLLAGTFNDDVALYAKKLLTREGVKLQLPARVLEVKEGGVTLQPRNGSKMDLLCGTCIWTAGIAPNPLVEQLRAKLGPEAQASPAGLVVDSRLRVAGSGGSIIALGDAAVTWQLKSAGHAEELFGLAGAGPEARLSMREASALLALAGRDFPQLGDLALQLDTGLFGAASRALFPNSEAAALAAKHEARLEAGLTLSEFTELLAEADAIARRLPPTAQVARQEGEYLASLFSHRLLRWAEDPAAGSAEAAGTDGNGAQPAVELSPRAPPFLYIHMGSLAYLGMNRAILQLPPPLPPSSIKGWLAGEVWKALELAMQVSVRNTWMLVSSLYRSRYFGRQG